MIQKFNVKNAQALLTFQMSSEINAYKQFKIVLTILKTILLLDQIITVLIVVSRCIGTLKTEFV